MINKYKVGKHFITKITNARFRYERDQAKIAAEAAFDGLYVIRTSVTEKNLSNDDTVRAYKDLAKVERGFRSLKTVDLKILPVYHWLEKRIRWHVFLCMLAYYVEWHMRQRLTPILFDDHDREDAERSRKSIVAPAPRSEAAKRKDANKATDDGYPVQSFRVLLDDLGTLAKNRIRAASDQPAEFTLLTRPTRLQNTP